jgi:hypothetical protein
MLKRLSRLLLRIHDTKFPNCHEANFPAPPFWWQGHRAAASGRLLACHKFTLAVFRAEAHFFMLGDMHINIMKKRAFFLTSLPFGLAALTAQAFLFYFILQAIGQAFGNLMWLMPPYMLIPHSQPAQSASTESSDGIVIFIIMSGVISAVLSLVCLIFSFRRHEPGWGWRIIPITLLTVYLGTWLILLHG